MARGGIQLLSKKDCDIKSIIITDDGTSYILVVIATVALPVLGVMVPVFVVAALFYGFCNTVAASAAAAAAAVAANEKLLCA